MIHNTLIELQCSGFLRSSVLYQVFQYIILVYMQFELTDALIDEILFSMEDQNGEFCLDTVEGVVVGGVDGPDISRDDDDGEGGERYISLPEWDSASGFRLMEHFITQLRNPMVREELSSALGRGRGVFRAFKDTLGRYPEAEKLWFSFKEREMKLEIIRWYNGLREEWGLEKVGMEPEETEDLVLEDFRFRPFRREDLALVGELHRLCLEEHKRNAAEAGRSPSVQVNADGVLELPFEKAMIAETGGGEFAGYIAGILQDSIFRIQRLEVMAEYRGLGVGETLLGQFLDSLDPNEVMYVLFDLPSRTEGFSRVLSRESFRPYMVRYCLNLWKRDD